MNYIKDATINFTSQNIGFDLRTISLHEVRLISLGSKGKVHGSPAQIAGTLLGTFSTASAIPVPFTVTEIIANCSDPFSGNFPTPTWDGYNPGSANDDIQLEYRVTDNEGNVSQWFKFNSLVIDLP